MHFLSQLTTAATVFVAVTAFHSRMGHWYDSPFGKPSSLPPAMRVPDNVGPSPYSPHYTGDFNRNFAVAEPYHSEGDARTHLVAQDVRQYGATARSRTQDLPRDYSQDDSPMTKSIAPSDMVAIVGFQYCPMLDRSVFVATVPFSPKFSSQSDKLVPATTIRKYGVAKFVTFVDKVARQIFIDIARMRRDAAVANDETKIRFACYLAAGGQNEYVRYAKRSFLHVVDGQTYFPTIGWGAPKFSEPIRLEDVSQNEEIIPVSTEEISLHSDKPHFKMAYTLLVHDNLEGIEYLVGTLESPNSVIMIHVDGKESKFRETLMARIAQHTNDGKWRNVHVTKNSHASRWAGVGIVYGQLTAYFELLNICTFEYVINASSNDVALMDPDVMYDWIVKRNPSANYMMNLGDMDGREDKYNRANRGATFQSRDFQPLYARDDDNSDLRIRSFDGYKYWPMWQWTILTYALVHTMRHDPVAPTILVPLEWGNFIDETYFAQYLQWNDNFAHTMDGYSHRCIKWEQNSNGWWVPGRVRDSPDFIRYLDECVSNGASFVRKWHIDEARTMMPYFMLLRFKARGDNDS